MDIGLRTWRMNSVPKTDRVLLVSNIEPIGLLCSSERFFIKHTKNRDPRDGSYCYQFSLIMFVMLS